MINLYRILDIEPTANEKSIQAGIAIYRLRADADDRVVQAARQWLLDPHIRRQYDQKLFQQSGLTPIMETPPAHAQPDPKINTSYVMDKKNIPTTQLTEFEHLYQFLGIRTTASYADIAESIDQAVLEGLNGKTIQLAREHLLDPEARARYDLEQGIESAAAIIDDPNEVTLFARHRLNLPIWLTTIWRKLSSNKAQVTTHHATTTTATPPQSSHPISSIDSTIESESILLDNTEPSVSNTPSAEPPHTSAQHNQTTTLPKPEFKRDNWYRFLGIRGDASYHEIKIALRKAKLKGRDKELIRQSENMLLIPGNRRLYDKKNQIAAFIAAQNGDIYAHVPATDYQPAATIAGISLQKILLVLWLILGLSTGFMPWLAHIQGFHFFLAWPLYMVCILTFVCTVCGHAPDPLYRGSSLLLCVALLPMVGLLALLNVHDFQAGIYCAIAAMMGLFLTPWLFGQQARNVSYQIKGQQLFALLALMISLAWAAYCAWKWSHLT